MYQNYELKLLYYLYFLILKNHKMYWIILKVVENNAVDILEVRRLQLQNRDVKDVVEEVLREADSLGLAGQVNDKQPVNDEDDDVEDSEPSSSEGGYVLIPRSQKFFFNRLLVRERLW